MAASRPVTANSAEGRVLLALRAGPMATDELAERFGRAHGAGALVRRGWAIHQDGLLRLTPAGRAACPFRNPLAAGAPDSAASPQPKEISMASHANPLASAVLRHLTAAGGAGLTRAALVDQLIDLHDAPSIDSCLSRLCTSGQVVRPRRGLLVAREYAGQHAGLAALSSPPITPPPAPVAAPADQPPVSETTGGSAEPVALLCPGDRAVAPKRGADATAIAPELRAATRQRPAAPSRREDGQDISFCLWEDGVLCIHLEGTVIELPEAATRRLAHFVGQIDEVAP